MDKNKFINIYTIIITIITVVAIIVGVTRVFGTGKLFKFNNKESFTIGDAESSSETIDCADFININIDVEVSDVTIEPGDSYQVYYEYHSSNGKTVAPEVKVEGNTLKITQNIKPKVSVGINNKDCKIVITVPEKAELKDLILSTDVGDIELNALTTDTITIKSDVGEVSYDNINTHSTKITSDVGDITIKNSTIESIDTSSGVGEISINDTITDDVKAESGVGDITLKNVYDATGNEPRLNVEAGVGDKKINE